MASRLGSIIADAVELQVRSVSALLDLSKGYVKALDGIMDQRQDGRQHAGKSR